MNDFFYHVLDKEEFCSLCSITDYGRPEIASTAQPKIQSQSQIFSYGRSIFCLPHGPKISDFFDLCLHWVSVVRDHKHTFALQESYFKNPELLATFTGFGNSNIVLIRRANKVLSGTRFQGFFQIILEI